MDVNQNDRPPAVTATIKAGNKDTKKTFTKKKGAQGKEQVL